MPTTIKDAIQQKKFRILNGSHPNSLNLSQIKSRMLDKMSDTSRVVERLRLSGYLTRVPSKEDRRESIITISKKGLKLVEEMKIEEVSMDQISKGLTATEAAQLCKLLDKFRRDELND